MMIKIFVVAFCFLLAGYSVGLMSLDHDLNHLIFIIVQGFVGSLTIFEIYMEKK